ncbi:hypothetical protein [Bacteroides caecimuris]|uniref:hypothetical protein n=1 Tax=Bacteroides caecimuris TaxID=1796613 RepID=UPI001C3C71B8|nr:hypothetical protein [Bacteroides caecimuris]
MKNKVIFSLLSVLFLSSCNEEIAEKMHLLKYSFQMLQMVPQEPYPIPHIIWEYEEFKNGLYEFFYPSVPIEPIIQ